MKNKIDTQRHSPSSPNLQADNHKGDGEGLDVTACSASSFAWDLGWDDDKKLLFKLMYKFASPEHRERANSDPEIANMAHDFAEIVTHRSDLKPEIESPSVSTFGKAKIES